MRGRAAGKSQPGRRVRRLSETVVLIPAAGRVAEGVMVLSNIGCPAMVPVAGRPVIHWTLSYLRSLGLSKFIIAVSRRGMFVEDFVDCSFGQDCDIRFIVPSVRWRRRPHGARTGRACPRHVGAGRAGRHALPVRRSGGLAAATSRRCSCKAWKISYRWCTAETDADGIVTAWHDKEAGPESAAAGVDRRVLFPRS